MRRNEVSSDLEWADLRSAAGWLRKYAVGLGAIVMIVLQLGWKAQFLSTLYFRQDDFHDLELAVEHSFNWSYLTFIGSGHLIIGLRAIAWAMVRVSTPYNWGLASAVSLVFVAAASLAAYRLLRNLFGPRPMILVLLAIYLLSPLTVPDLGIWSSAMESVPLQLAILMALNSHVSYIRTGRWWHLLFAVFWMAFGLVFFEKALVLPILLFAVTAAFLTDRRTLLGGIMRSLLRYWLAWVIYLVLDIAYAILLIISLRTSATRPHSPTSFSSVLAFSGGLVKESLLPGALGGPWQWLPTSDKSYSFAFPPTILIWISVILAVVIIVASVLGRRITWRAWAILVVWVALADVLPVIVGRISAFSQAATLLGLETRYLADAVPILIICLGLAFLPLVTDQQRRAMRAAAAQAAATGHRRQPQRESVQVARMIAAVLLGIFVFGSIWSVQAYENVTTGNVARTYVANSEAATRLVPPGTPVFNVAVPINILEGLFGQYTRQSRVIGDEFMGKLARRIVWVTKPRGTLDGLRMFGPNGQLYAAQVIGATSLPAPARGCWPAKNRQIVVQLFKNSPAYTGILRLGYIWSGHAPGQVDVQFGSTERTLTVKPGLHSAYLAVSGQASQIIVQNLSAGRMCIGDAQAGNLAPATAGKALPPISY